MQLTLRAPKPWAQMRLQTDESKQCTGPNASGVSLTCAICILGTDSLEGEGECEGVRMKLP